MCREYLKYNKVKNHKDWYKHDGGHWCVNCHCKDRHQKQKIKLENHLYRHYNKEFAPTCKDNIYCSRPCGAQVAYSRIDKEATNKHSRDRYKNNINHRLAQAVGTRINKALGGSCKWCSTIKSLDCSPEELKKHLEQFTENMTWDNWILRDWHIGHIKPLNAFDLANPKEFKEACHYTNLQPLWAKDNLSKGNKYE